MGGGGEYHITPILAQKNFAQQTRGKAAKMKWNVDGINIKKIGMPLTFSMCLNMDLSYLQSKALIQL